jgi:hypothetical protein
MGEEPTIGEEQTAQGGLEKTIRQIELLIVRHDRQHEVVEDELKPLVYEFIETHQSIPEAWQVRCEAVLLHLAAMGKSSNFGFNFYRELSRTSWPFTQAVLERALYIEQHGDDKKEILAGQLITTLRNNGLSDKSVDQYLRHGDLQRDAPEVLPRISTLPQEDYIKARSALTYALLECPFDTGDVALRGVVVFQMPEMVPILRQALRRYFTRFEEYGQPNFNQNRYQSCEVDFTADIAGILFRMTGRDSYQTIQGLLNGEHDAMFQASWEHDPKYHERFAQVYAQVSELIESAEA